IIGVRSEAIPGKLNEVEGLMRGFIPTTLDTSIIDEWYECSNKDSFMCARRLISEEGLLCGGSSGAAMSIALEAAKELNVGQRCVVMLADSARNYLTKFISDDWMRDRKYLEKEVSTKIQRWREMKVSSLDLVYSPTLLASLPCNDCINIMEMKELEQMSVVDERGTPPIEKN
ncbi:cystathionine beta-synthase-like, partial [Saccoglossus kowalevskii]|uniref:Cystathionine beta-synthase-like n=1 Tax=Saccoglossus kowalevskii TaxID=10224 RepID=A0ABM0LYW2_SACKO